LQESNTPLIIGNQFIGAIEFPISNFKSIQK
jgi:hypothetical protein